MRGYCTAFQAHIFSLVMARGQDKDGGLWKACVCGSEPMPTVVSCSCASA
jgi:hypothetical protein